MRRRHTRFNCRERVKYFTMGIGMAIFIGMAMLKRGMRERRVSDYE